MWVFRKFLFLSLFEKQEKEDKEEELIEEDSSEQIEEKEVSQKTNRFKFWEKKDASEPVKLEKSLKEPKVKKEKVEAMDLSK